jgi:predicted PurR-regulated permease PerM
VLLPRITAILLAAFFTAYAVSPVVEFLDRRLRLPRSVATALLMLTALCFLLLLLLIILPAIFAQLADAVQKLPGLLVAAINWGYEKAYLNGIDLNEYQNLTEEALFDRLGSFFPAFDSLPDFIGAVFQKTFSVLAFFIDLLIYAVVTFFASTRLPAIYDSLVALLPPAKKDEMLVWLEKFDRVLSGFIRGQIMVCFVLGSFYALGLTIAGLDQGASLGVLIGTLCFVPYIGLITGVIIAALLALSAGGAVLMLKVVSVFVVIQTIDTIAITPNIMGKKVGISPVFVIIALFAGAELAGFLGVLVAVPTFAILKIISGYIVEKYKSSAIYNAPVPVDTPKVD